MALSDQTVQARMVSGAGEIISDQWKGDNSTSYVAGQWLRKSQAGTMLPAAANAAAGVHAIYAGATLTAATAGFIPIRLIMEDTIFLMQLHHTTAATANPAQALMGDQYGIDVDSGIVTVDLESTNDVVEITGIWENDYDFDTAALEAGNFGLVYAKVLASQINTAPAAS